VQIRVELDPAARPPACLAPAEVEGDGLTVGNLPLALPLVVAPEDTLGADPTTIQGGASAADAAGLMTEHGSHHLPVVDEDGRPVAILGLRDVVSVSLKVPAGGEA